MELFKKKQTESFDTISYSGFETLNDIWRNILDPDELESIYTRVWRDFNPKEKPSDCKFTQLSQILQKKRQADHDYQRRKREQKELYNSRLKIVQTQIDTRDGKPGLMSELNMLLLNNTIKEFKGSRELEYHFDIHSLRNFAEHFMTAQEPLN